MPPEARRLKFSSLGTTCRLYALGEGMAELERTAAWLAQMHGRLSRFEPASELSFLNAAAGGWTQVSPELEALLFEALRAHRLSGGLVHAGILRSMRAIGYTRPLAEGPTAAALLEAAPPPPLPEILELAGNGRARLSPGHGIDLGGIAKGWLADRAVQMMGPNSLAKLGGDLVARGPGPKGDGWPVRMGQVTVLLRDQALATSGTWRRRWADALSLEPLHHLIHPLTGRPARSDLLEVSAVAVDGVLAEICAKTALLLGSDRAPAFLAAHAEAWWLV